MSKIEDGKPAYPGWAQNYYTDQPPVGGMTLRDYFAANALQALIPMGHEELEEFCGNYDGVTTNELLAKSAYDVAYEMLQRRAAIAKATGQQS